MTTRNPFAFLDSETQQRRVLLLLLALIKKQGGTVSLSVDDLTSIDDGSSFSKEPDDKGTSLMLRFARRGSEAYFLTPTPEEGSPSSTPKTSRVSPRTSEDPLPTPRHAIHDDMDLAMREEEMATRAEQAQQKRLRQARAEAGAMPWRTRPQ